MRNLINQLPHSNTANQALLNGRYQPQLIESLTDTLLRAKGLAGFLQDTAVIAQQSDKSYYPHEENLEALGRTLVLDIEEALVMIDDLTKQASDLATLELTALKELDND